MPIVSSVTPSCPLLFSPQTDATHFQRAVQRHLSPLGVRSDSKGGGWKWEPHHQQRWNPGLLKALPAQSIQHFSSLKDGCSYRRAHLDAKLVVPLRGDQALQIQRGGSLAGIASPALLKSSLRKQACSGLREVASTEVTQGEWCSYLSSCNPFV